MAKLSHYFEYAAMALLRGLVSLPSAKTADAIGSGLGKLAHDLISSRRQIAKENITHALGDEYTEEEIDRIVENVFRNIGRTMVEIGRLSKLGYEGAAKLISSDDGHIIKRVYEEGKGGVLVEPHSGNWELLAIWPRTLGLPLDILMGTLHNPLVDRMAVNIRKKTGVSIITITKSFRSAFKSIKSGRLTAIAADQHAPAGNIIAPFFGREASMAGGPALLAIRTGCPIVPVGFMRERYDKHVIFCGEPIYPPNSGDENADMVAMTKAYFAWFEHHIRRFPDQWMWTHRRWKQINKTSIEGVND